MKKHILAIILCVLCASLVFVLASCGDTNTNTDSGSGECTEHSFGDWTTETYASCTSAGLKVRVCTKCSFEEEEEIPAGHKFGDWETVTELSCEQNGVMQRICSACDFVEEDTTEATGHAWGDWAVTTPGDCTNKGEETRVCDNCGADETREIVAEGHSWSEWGFDVVGDSLVEESTCTVAGYTGRECFNCGERETQDLPLADHPWGNWNITGDCENGAEKNRTCTACSEYEEETTLPGEHTDVVFSGYAEPTEEQDGSTGKGVCQSCGETVVPEKTITKIQNIASKAQLSTNIECWVVAKGLSALVDGDFGWGMAGSYNDRSFDVTFDYGKNVTAREIILTVNGMGKTHANEIKEQSNLDFPIRVRLYDADGKIVHDESYQTANKTEITILAPSDFAKMIITVTSEWKSERTIWEVQIIGSMVISACDLAGSHSWGDWKTVIAPTCSQETLNDGLERRVCPACGDVEEKVIVAEHPWGAWDESAVECLVGGTRTRSCTSCGKVESQTVEQGGHVEVVVEGAVAPTFEAAGSTGKKVCNKCGATVEEAKVITKLENIASQATVTTNAWHWQVVGNGGWAVDTIPYLTDGKHDTGSPSCAKTSGNQKTTLTFSDAVDILEIVIVCNGKGNIGALGNVEEMTNFAVNLTVSFYDAEGNLISSQTQNTVDVTSLTYANESGKEVKSVEVSYPTSYVADTLYIWEIEAISGGQIVE